MPGLRKSDLARPTFDFCLCATTPLLKKEMLSRRTLIKNSLYAGLASASPFVFAEDKGESKYKVLNAKQFVGKQIGVVNFFSYACPHCLRFEDAYRPFEQVLVTKGIPCQGVPVLLDASHVTFSQAYYAFIYLGVLSQFHLPFWQWVLLEEHQWKTVQDLQNDIASWVSKKGVPEEKWKLIMASSFVKNKIGMALQYVEDYGITESPCVAVNGQYLTSPAMAGSSDGCIEVIKALLKKEGV